jgi:PAS domain-containing protein
VVLGVDVTLLTHPVLLRMAALFFVALLAFVLGFVVIRHWRRTLVEEASFSPQEASSEASPLHTYHAVIQQLKQQKHELQSQQQVERRRARTTEHISAAVLSNLSSGVLFFTPKGLVRQANLAARQILGFASPAGMSSQEVFRDARIVQPNSESSITAIVLASLREKSVRHVEARYWTPAGEERMLDITVTSISSAEGEVLAAACLIEDQTEMERMRRQQEMRGETCSEMALELRNSLATISGYARQAAGTTDLGLVRQLAGDIVSEAAHLDHTIGGFLAQAGGLTAALER